ncbi:hypothetical protein Xcab_04300 [Xenorhabdus cabanillasii JM26]|nr:hypothetical protein Xcab_04300 [Xenorhabdus cabanillasii JM26]
MVADLFIQVTYPGVAFEFLPLCRSFSFFHQLIHAVGFVPGLDLFLNIGVFTVHGNEQVGSLAVGKQFGNSSFHTPFI